MGCRKYGSKRLIDQKMDELLTTLGPGETLSCEEIAELTGASRNTIQRIQREALEKMRQSEALRQYAEID